MPPDEKTGVPGERPQAPPGGRTTASAWWRHLPRKWQYLGRDWSRIEDCHHAMLPLRSAQPVNRPADERYPEADRSRSGRVWGVRHVIARPRTVTSRATTVVLVVGALAATLAMLTWSRLSVGADPGAVNPSRWLGLLPAQAESTSAAAWLLIALLASLAVLAGCWWRLQSALRSPRPGATWLAGVAWLTWSLPFLIGPPVGSRDIYAYAAQGELARQGLDPTRVPVLHLGPGVLLNAVDPRWRAATPPYGGLAVGLERFAATLGGPVGSLVVFRVMAALGVMALVLASVALARRAASTVPSGRVVVLVGCNPLVLIHVLSGAHLDAVAAALLIAGVALAWPYGSLPPGAPRPAGWPRRWGGQYGPVAAGALLCGLAGGIKVTALLGAAWIIVRQLRRRPGGSLLRWDGITGALAGALGALAGLAIATAVGGVGLGWLSSLGTPGKLRTGVAPADTLARAIARVVGDLGGVSNSGPVLSASRAAVAGVGVLIACWFLLGRPTLRGGRREAGVSDLGYALLAVALAGPVLYPWYLAPAFAVLAVAGERSRRLLAAGSAFLVLATLPTVRPLSDEVSGGAAIALVLAVVLGLVVALPGRRSGAASDAPDVPDRPADQTASTALTAAATSSALRDSNSTPAPGRPWSRSL
jgi:hypothetical protein